MMRSPSREITLALALLAGWLAWPQQGLAQSDTTDGDGSGITTGSPRENVRGGAIASRRPGLRIQASIGRHIERQNLSLREFGGATLVSEDQLPPPRRRVFLLEFIESLFSSLQQITTMLGLGAAVNTGT